MTRACRIAAVLIALLVVTAVSAPAQESAQRGDQPRAGEPQATRADEATALPQREPKTTLPDIEDEVMCPICGVTLELATDAPQAQRQREFIRELIVQGLTKEQIKDRLVAELGPEVLAVPEDEGFDLAAWLVPAVGIIAAAIAIAIGLRRWRRNRPDNGQNGSAEPPDQPLDPADAKRLEADLGRYEL